MTLVCEDGNSRLIEVVTVVEVDDEKHVDNSLVQVWKINFGLLKLYRRCNQGSRLKKQWLHAT